jgi:folate-binding protein YgfZ|tara:strand:- start:109 stop:999 length:891 start_codon:yes stop_codon:yes gene_type:complete
MEINETTVLKDRGFIQINGIEAKDFLQNIVTNDIEKISESFTLFSSIFTPQGKYLYEFFILKLSDGYLLECEKSIVLEIIKILNFYKLRSKVNLIDVSKKYTNIVISLEKLKTINDSKPLKGLTVTYNKEIVYVDPRNENLGAKIVSRSEKIGNIIKDLDLKEIDNNKYYTKSFDLGIPQINLSKLKDKIFGVENNLDELGGIDFKKGCYIGQENTSRIKLRNKLRKRILPIKKISGEIYENDIIKYKDIEIGKIMIDKPYPFGLIKVVEPDLKEFTDIELVCGKSKVKIIKPKWI